MANPKNFRIFATRNNKIIKQKNMVKEVILVEVVTKSDMSTDKSKTFTDTEKAEKYFADCIHDIMSNIEQDEIDNALDDGFWDCIITPPKSLERDEKSVIIKEISYEDD